MTTAELCVCAGLLFTVGILLVASGSVAASSANRWWNKL